MLQVRNHVRSLVRNGAYTAAITAAAEFARRNPDRAECYGLLAQAEEIAGYTRAAIQSVSHAIALAPQESAYRLLRSRLYLKANRLAETVEDANCIIDADDPDYLDAAIACRDEAFERATRHARTSAARNSPHPVRPGCS